MAGSDDEVPPPPPLTQTQTQQAPHTVSTIKLLLLKKGEYDIWAMKMEHYLAHTDYPIWEVIQKGNVCVSVSTDTHGVIKVLPPKTVKEILAREKERKARTTLLMALPEDHLAKFHKMTNAKEMWEAIKSRFGGNDESKKMQNLLSQLEIHGAGVTVEDATQKVFESDVKGSTASSSSTLNMAFVSKNTSSTNEVSTAYGASSSSEEMDLKWQVAMIFMRIKKFYKKTGRRLHFVAKEPVGFDKSNLECYNCHKKGHFAKECRFKGNQENRRIYAWNSGYKVKDNETRPGKQEKTKALVTLDGDGSDTEVTSCSKECKESYAKIKKLYDEQREQLSDASIEIQAYTQALKKVEAQLVAHQQSQLWYYRYDGILSYENEVLQSVFMNKESDYSLCIIESDSEDKHVSLQIEEQEIPSFANKQVKTPRETVKNQFTHSKNSKVDKKGLGYGFVTKACFVCGSLSHFIRDCDFYEKRMAKQAELNNRMRKKSSQREIRTIWNNVKKVNHKNQFVPTAVLTRTRKIPVNIARASGTNNVSTARHNFKSQAVLTNVARKIS
ncbi:ribonuclease H-like domain-containing protein [Tanacetum coccineum]